MDMERIIALYMDDCHSRQLRPKTMQSYEQALRLFATWLKERHEITQVEAVKDIHIRSYINELQTRGKYAEQHEAMSAINDIGTALYEFRRHVKLLQEAHTKEVQRVS